MKGIVIGLFLSCIALNVLAQDFPSFQALRYDEDYSNFSGDSTRTRYGRLKHAGLWRDDAYLSFGGGARYQFINVENEDWGETTEGSDQYVLARHLFHIDFHGGKRWRAFFEFQSSLALDKTDVSPLDHNPLELHQGFMDYAFVYTVRSKLTLRLGRQELLYGSQRLVSVRNGPNNRQAFDGIKVLYTSDNTNLDYFFSDFVVARPKSFNDSGEDVIRLWGGYWVQRNVPFFGNVDLYYLGFFKRIAGYDDGAGSETRHSVGTRIWKRKGPLSMDIECVYQFGDVGSQTIRAWTTSLKSEYRIGAKRNSRVGIKTEIISGDGQYHDGAINTFCPLFPSGAYFGLAALIGPSNLFDVHPSLSLSLSENLEWKFDYDIFWRQSRNDGIYTNNGRLIYTGRGNEHLYIGSQVSTDIDFQLSRFITFSSEFKWFVTGSFLKTAGEGENILFGMLSAEFKF